MGLGRASPASTPGRTATPPAPSRRLLRLGRASVLIVVLLAVAAGLLPLVVPGGLFAREGGRLAAAVIFVASVSVWRGSMPR